MAGTTRSFAPGHFLVELDGAPAGYARNVEGGGAHADVIQAVGPGNAIHKHVGMLHYDDIVLSCDAGLSKAFYDWASHMSRGHAWRKDGAVDVSSGRETSRLEWKTGMIKGIYFPALDAAAGEAFLLTVKISPESTRSAKGGGARSAVVTKGSPSSAFRLRIDGLEEACAHVSRIEPIGVEQKTTRVAVGGMRDYELAPVKLDPGNLIVTLPESKAAGFYAWFQDVVTNGNNTPDRAKRGRLDVGPFSLEFGNLGVFGITRPATGPEKSIRKIKVEMYCDSIGFQAKT